MLTLADTCHHTCMSNTTERETFSISPLPTEIVERIRTTLVDDFGNHLEVIASQPVPCRHCLKITQAGERVILFACQPFDTTGPYAEIGPVFVHAEPCSAYAQRTDFPEGFRERILTMRGYDSAGRIAGATLSTAGRPEATIDELFADASVRYIHVRNPAWGCYDFRVDRASDS